MNPQEIENRSMEIIESELTVALNEEIKPIVKRVIHATADFSFAENMRFTPGVVPLMRDMLKRGATVVTDTNMALSGINKKALEHLGARALCLMADETVAAEAKTRGTTRAVVCMERALSLPGPRLIVCGNAPTFLFPLLDRAKELTDTAVIGVPVGFVNVVEAKQRLWDSGLNCIVAMGRRGGSNVAAAIVNALMYGIEGARA
ncbi:MAG: precorrin-8X methylmutase [Clostridia bacterium]|nr:precorrin-8X methylmutase [Clostridia bacterium]